MNVDPAHVYMVLVLIMRIATLVLVMMATLEQIVKQVRMGKHIYITVVTVSTLVLNNKDLAQSTIHFLLMLHIYNYAKSFTVSVLNLSHQHTNHEDKR